MAKRIKNNKPMVLRRTKYVQQPLLDEGSYVFKIESVDYDKSKETVKLNLVTKDGVLFSPRFPLLKGNSNEPNYFISEMIISIIECALQLEDQKEITLTPSLLNRCIGRYIEADIIHKEYKKNVYALIDANNIYESDGFDEDTADDFNQDGFAEMLDQAAQDHFEQN